MSHTTIAATRDYLPGHDKGDLVNPAQSASFVVDPMLTPISTSAMPKPMLPDPTPSDNPELFDKSTNHPNNHYHPEAKLSKKKRAKKLGLGYVAAPHGATGVHAGGRTFSEHEKEAHERAEKRDAAIGTTAAEHEEEYETDEDDEDDKPQELEQSHKQNHENRITGSETGNTQQPASKRHENAKDDKEGDKEAAADDEEQQAGGDKSDNPSLIQRASNVLSSAQQKATGMATGVASSVVSTAQSVPLVGSLLSKMGLGSSKSDDSAAADKQKEGGEEAGEEQEQEQDDEQQEGAGGSGGKAGKVGGNRERETEAVTKGAGEQSTSEAATKGGNEAHGKQGARQDNSEGALDKSRSQAGQKVADNMRAVNQQAKKEEEA